MAKCDRCGTETENPTKFCGNCGAKFVPRPETVMSGDDGAFFCQRHPREVTRLTCGKCERPICTRCLVMSPAGVRCRDCARNRVPISARGVLHDAKSAISPMDGRKIWYLYILSWIARFFGGWFR